MKSWNTFGQLRIAKSFTLFGLNDDEPVELKNDDQRVFAGEEDVHVADDFVVEDEQQSEGEEGSVLKNDVDKDRPDIDRAANLHTFVTAAFLVHFFLLLLLLLGLLGEDQCELQQTPRPDGKRHVKERFTFSHCFVLKPSKNPLFQNSFDKCRQSNCTKFSK